MQVYEDLVSFRECGQTEKRHYYRVMSNFSYVHTATVIFNALVRSFIIAWLLTHKDTIKQIKDTKSLMTINELKKNC